MKPAGQYQQRDAVCAVLRSWFRLFTLCGTEVRKAQLAQGEAVTCPRCLAIQARQQEEAG